jgi:hypothetical protein
MKLVKCNVCDGPVIQGSTACNHCLSALSGKEPRYLVTYPEEVTLRPLLTQLGIIMGCTLMFTGFQPSPMWRVFMAAVMIYYLMRGVKTWYSL